MKNGIPCERPRFAAIQYNNLGMGLETLTFRPNVKHPRPTPGAKSLGESILNATISGYLQNSGHLIKPFRTPGLVCLYERKTVISESMQGNLIEEIVGEIPLVDSATVYETKTENIFGLYGPPIEFMAVVSEYPGNNAVKQGKKSKMAISFDTPDLGLNESGSIPHLDLFPLPSLATVDTTNLKNELFLDPPALVRGNSPGSKSIIAQFINIPSYITPKLAYQWLHYFVLLYPQQTSKVIYGTSGATSNSVAQLTRTTLGVFLPLAFSNVVVFKAIMLWSSTICSNTNGPDRDDCISISPRLFADVITSLNHRLQYRSGVCCDHTIAITLLLYNSLMVQSNVDPHLWHGLNDLTIKAISLRGGLDLLSQTPAGEYFAKLFCFHYFTGFGYSLVRHDLDSLNIHSIQAVFNSPAAPGLNQHYLGLKAVCSIVGEIFHLYGLMKLTRSASQLNTSDFDLLPQDESLIVPDQPPQLKPLVDVSTNILAIMEDAHRLEARITAITDDSLLEWEENSNSSWTLITSFVREATLLLLYQLIYHQPSLAPMTLVQVAKVIPLMDRLFHAYDTEPSLNVYVVLPIFVVGCDIIEPHHRRWLIQWLDRLHWVRSHNKFATIKMLLERVWAEGNRGNSCVLWPDIADDNGLILPVYV